VSAANSISLSSFCFHNLRFSSVVKEACLDISEAQCSMQSKKNPEILNFSLLQTFWNKVEENCTLSLP
jgi:hypothetical protein